MGYIRERERLDSLGGSVVEKGDDAERDGCYEGERKGSGTSAAQRLKEKKRNCETKAD